MITYRKDGTMEVIEITPATKVSGLKAPKWNEFWPGGAGTRESQLAGVAAWAKKHGLAFHVTRWKD
jgi:hypothetical protein